MKHRTTPILRTALLACCLAAAFPAARAAETGSTTTTTTSTTTTSSTGSTTTTTTAIGTSANTEAKLAAEFADFLGGEEQASAVVSGLRQGTAFTLDTLEPTPVGSTTSSGTTTTTTVAMIDPPTGTMGYGNVRITLRLAEAELARLGITEPTTEELAAVLIGGNINGAPVDGILTMRADGMGWGQIAKEYGMTVGQLMGKGAAVAKAAPTPAPYGQARTSSASTKLTGGSNASGKAAHANGYIPSSTKTTPTARSNGYIPSGGRSSGAGVVTAGGSSLGGASSGHGKGQANKVTGSTQGAGGVSAGGQQVSMSGVSSAGGDAKGMAPGQARKN